MAGVASSAVSPREWPRTPRALFLILLGAILAFIPSHAQTQKFVNIGVWANSSLSGDPEGGIRAIPLTDLYRYDALGLRRGYAFNYNNSSSTSRPTLWRTLRNNKSDVRIFIYSTGATAIPQQSTVSHVTRSSIGRVLDPSSGAGGTDTLGALDNSPANATGRDFRLKNAAGQSLRIRAGGTSTTSVHYFMELGHSGYIDFWTEAIRRDLFVISVGASNVGDGASGIHTDNTKGTTPFPPLSHSPGASVVGLSDGQGDVVPVNNVGGINYATQAGWEIAVRNFYQGAASRLGAFSMPMQIQASTEPVTPERRQLWLDLDEAPAAKRPGQLMAELMFEVDFNDLPTVPGSPNLQYRFGAVWVDMIQMLANIDKTEVFSANNSEFGGNSANLNATMIDQFGITTTQEEALTYALTSFLLVKRDSPRWFFLFNYQRPNITTTLPYYPEYDALNGNSFNGTGNMNLGAPRDGFGASGYRTFNWGGQTLYFRRFANGYVLVNPNNAVVSNIPLNDPGLFGAPVRRITRSNLTASLDSIGTSTTITLGRCRGAIFRTTATAAPSPPAAPSGLTATAASSSQINLRWTDNASNETGFEIDRALNSTFTSGQVTSTTGAVGGTGGTGTFPSTGLSASTTYFYRVRATNANGDSANSNTASATTQGAGGTTVTLFSEAARDGHVLESSETSGVGGSIDAGSATFRTGDDTLKKQYRGILSFATGTLPDGVTIKSATLRIRRQSLVGNPFTTAFGAIRVDAKQNNFNNNAALETADFAATAEDPGAATLSVPANNGDWATAAIPVALIRTSGANQFRIRFTGDDDNDSANDYVQWHSGSAVAGSQPELVIVHQ